MEIQGFTIKSCHWTRTSQNDGVLCKFELFFLSHGTLRTLRQTQLLMFLFSVVFLYQTFRFHFIETKIHPDHSAVKMSLRHLPAVSFGQAEMNYKWK